MLKSSVYTTYYWLKNRWQKLSRCRLINHQHDIFLLLTLKSSAKSLSLPIQKSAAMIKSFLVLHLATFANHHIYHKYNHNHNSKSNLLLHNRTCLFINKQNQSIIWFVLAATSFQGSLITQFALNIIPTPFHITSSIKHAEFTSLTQVWLCFWFKYVPRSLTRLSSMHLITLIHILFSPHHGRPSPRFMHSKSFMFLR
jgi:hypothetical protein